MITKKQMKIFEVFAKRPFAEYTRNELKRNSNEKSNKTLALVVNSLKKEEVLTEKRIGKSGILTLNLNKDLSFYYLALCNNFRIPHLANLSLEALKNEILEDTPFLSIVIFGSYANGEQRKESDLDIAIFIENTNKKRQIELSAKSAELRSPLKMDVHIIPIKEMLYMLLKDKHENLGKQIARKHLAVYNHRIFYEIIKGGIAHGFRP